METMMGYIEESAAQCRRNIEHASQLVHLFTLTCIHSHVTLGFSPSIKMKV